MANMDNETETSGTRNQGLMKTSDEQRSAPRESNGKKYDRRKKNHESQKILSKAIIANIEGLVDMMPFNESELPDLLTENGCLTEEECSGIRCRPKRKEQVREVIVLMKGREFKVQEQFLRSIEIFCPEQVKFIWSQYEDFMKDKRLSKCPVCELKANVDIKCVMDHLYSKHVIKTGTYLMLNMSNEPIGCQGNLWEKMLEVCMEQDNLKHLMNSLEEKKYGHLAKSLKAYNTCGVLKPTCSCEISFKSQDGYTVYSDESSQYPESISDFEPNDGTSENTLLKSKLYNFASSVETLVSQSLHSDLEEAKLHGLTSKNLEETNSVNSSEVASIGDSDNNDNTHTAESRLGQGISEYRPTFNQDPQEPKNMEETNSANSSEVVSIDESDNNGNGHAAEKHFGDGILEYQSTFDEDQQRLISDTLETDCVNPSEVALIDDSDNNDNRHTAEKHLGDGILEYQSTFDEDQQGLMSDTLETDCVNPSEVASIDDSDTAENHLGHEIFEYQSIFDKDQQELISDTPETDCVNSSEVASIDDSDNNNNGHTAENHLGERILEYQSTFDEDQQGLISDTPETDNVNSSKVALIEDSDINDNGHTAGNHLGDGILEDQPTFDKDTLETPPCTCNCLKWFRK